MSQYEIKHTLTAGDTDAMLRYTLTSGGAAKNLTGFTEVKLYGRAQGGAAFAAITGSIVAPATSGVVEFDHTTIAATAGTYPCQVRCLNASSKISRSKKFAVLVEPAVEAET